MFGSGDGLVWVTRRGDSTSLDLASWRFLTGLRPAVPTSPAEIGGVRIKAPGLGSSGVRFSCFAKGLQVDDVARGSSRANTRWDLNAEINVRRRIKSMGPTV
jgi:hypothetical protein